MILEDTEPISVATIFEDGVDLPLCDIIDTLQLWLSSGHLVVSGMKDLAYLAGSTHRVLFKFGFLTRNPDQLMLQDITQQVAKLLGLEYHPEYGGAYVVCFKRGYIDHYETIEAIVQDTLSVTLYGQRDRVSTLWF